MFIGKEHVIISKRSHQPNCESNHLCSTPITFSFHFPSPFHSILLPTRNIHTIPTLENTNTDAKTTRGLGAEIARKFAAEGCNIAINYATKEEAATELANSIGDAYGVQTVVVKAVRMILYDS